MKTRYLHCVDCGVEKHGYASQYCQRCRSCLNKGRTSWHKGKAKSDAFRKAVSLGKGGDGVIGKKKLQITGIHAWSEAVRLRDGACIDCGSTELLEAHHLIMKYKFPEVATELWNGITLCRKCHQKEHSIIGYR